jgi:hypothetical protein
LNTPNTKKFKNKPHRPSFESERPILCPQARAGEYFAYESTPLPLHRHGMLPQRFALLSLQPRRVGISQHRGVAGSHQNAVELGDWKPVAAPKADESGHGVNGELFRDVAHLIWSAKEVTEKGRYNKKEQIENS